MNRTGVLLLVALLAAACDRSEPNTSAKLEAKSRGSKADLAPLRPALEAAPASATKSPVQTIGFDWGPPCRVPAIQEVDDDGKVARLAFDVVLERGPGGLVAKLDKMRVVSADKKALASLDDAVKSLDGAIPPIKVSDIGESEGAVDIDKAIDAVIALVPASEANPQIEKMFRSPQWRAMFEQKASETWDMWVGSFVQMEIAPNTTRSDTVDLPSAMATFKDVKLTVTHHGAVRDAPSLALLSIEQMIEGPELGRILVGALKDVMPASSGPPPTFKHAKKTDTVTVAIDPVLGRPHRSRHVMAIEIEDRYRRKSRDTAFDWSRATGCVASTK